MSDKKIGNVWIFIEQDEGRIADVSLELVCKGRELARELGVATEAVLLGHGVGSLAETLHHYGCGNVFLADDPALAMFTALPYTRVIVDLVKSHTPNIFMFGATPQGRA